jgi:NitT/TauT family transport system permease protein
MRGKWVPAAGLSLLAVIWAFAAYLGGADGFPSPVAVMESLAARFRDGTLIHGVLLSFRRLLIGYGISVVVGSCLGLAMAASDFFRRAFNPVIIGLSALPSICWLPLGLLWFGLSDAAILFVIVLGSSLSIAIAIDAGCRHVAPLYIRAGRTMGASGWTLYRRVVLPAALPEIVTGMRLAWAFAWRSLMAGELLFVTGGLGHLLQTGRELGDLAQVVAVMLVIVALGIATEQLFFASFQDKLRERWGRVAES